VAQIEFPGTFERGNPKVGGLSDPRMGTVVKSMNCDTCSSNMVQCPGHFGHLELAKPMLNVGFIRTVLCVLRCVCFNCSAILADEVIATLINFNLCPCINLKSICLNEKRFCFHGYFSSILSRSSLCILIKRLHKCNPSCI
jgi:DNA-directed RNA polymerase beta' subunit